MSIPITDKFKPRNNGGFPLMDAEDVLMPDGRRLDEALENMASNTTMVTLLAESDIPGFTAMGDVGMLTVEAPFALVAGETYKVLWDGEEYTCTAYTIGDSVTVGNGAITDAENYADTGEPFLVGYFYSDTDAVYKMSIIANDTETSHKVGVYQITEAPQLPAVTANDNGKFLRVVDGAWAAVAVDSAEEASF